MDIFSCNQKKNWTFFNQMNNACPIFFKTKYDLISLIEKFA